MHPIKDLSIWKLFRGSIKKLRSMKRIIRISMFLGFLLGSYCAKAQTSDYDKDLAKFLKLSNASATYDMMYDQMKAPLG